MESDPYINITFCAACPKCKKINQKREKDNMLLCINPKCKQLFCYICNKAIQDEGHYKVSNCHLVSDPWTDL